MIIIYLVFLSSFIGTGKAVLNEPDYESAYLKDVVNAQNKHNGFLDFSTNAMGSFCQNLFRTDKYKYSWKIHLNIQAYQYHEDNESYNERVTFLTLANTKHNSDSNQIIQNMVPCYGQHRPIRTNWAEDDYYEAFFVATIGRGDVVYVFKKEKKRNKVEFVIRDRIELTNFASVQFTNHNLLKRHSILNTVETINYDSKEVELIYFDEMIEDGTSFDDQLESLDAGKMVTVCLSIFLEKIFQDEGFELDHDEFFREDWVVGQNILMFRDYYKFLNHKQCMYSCKGKTDAETQTNYEKYYISSGRRLNSIFVYNVPNQMYNEAVPVYLIENFDFFNLKPSYYPTEYRVHN